MPAQHELQQGLEEKVTGSWDGCCPMGHHAAVQPSGQGQHLCMPTACSGVYRRRIYRRLQWGVSSAHLQTLEERTATLAAPKPVGSCVESGCVVVGPLDVAPNKSKIILK